MKLHDERGLNLKDDKFRAPHKPPTKARKDKGVPRLPVAAELANVQLGVKSVKMIREEFSGEKTLDVVAIEKELNTNPVLVTELNDPDPSGDEDNYVTSEICRKHYSNVEKQRQSEKKDIEYLLNNVIARK